MKHIALTGPAYSGKTTLAQELARHGYLLVSFTDLLKSYACRALFSINTHLTVAQINQDKERYRPFLQELSLMIKFDRNPMYVHEALQEWYESGRPPCVFDNVRDTRQAEELQWIGFQIVQLDVPDSLLASRAKTQPRREHPVEQPLDVHCLHIDAAWTPERIADLLMEIA